MDLPHIPFHTQKTQKRFPFAYSSYKIYIIVPVLGCSSFPSISWQCEF